MCIYGSCNHPKVSNTWNSCPFLLPSLTCTPALLSSTCPKVQPLKVFFEKKNKEYFWLFSMVPTLEEASKTGANKWSRRAWKILTRSTCLLILKKISIPFWDTGVATFLLSPNKEGTLKTSRDKNRLSRKPIKDLKCFDLPQRTSENLGKLEKGVTGENRSAQH